jgi:hypothetical protein
MRLQENERETCEGWAQEKCVSVAGGVGRDRFVLPCGLLVGLGGAGGDVVVRRVGTQVESRHGDVGSVVYDG